jgi:hypothetical protein
MALVGHRVTGENRPPPARGERGAAVMGARSGLFRCSTSYLRITRTGTLRPAAGLCTAVMLWEPGPACAGAGFSGSRVWVRGNRQPSGPRCEARPAGFEPAASAVAGQCSQSAELRACACAVQLSKNERGRPFRIALVRSRRMSERALRLRRASGRGRWIGRGSVGRSWPVAESRGSCGSAQGVRRFESVVRHDDGAVVIAALSGAAASAGSGPASGARPRRGRAGDPLRARRARTRCARVAGACRRPRA